MIEIENQFDKFTTEANPHRFDFISKGYTVIPSVKNIDEIEHFHRTVSVLRNRAIEETNNYPSVVFEPNDQSTVRSIFDIHNIMEKTFNAFFDNFYIDEQLYPYFGESGYRILQSHVNYKQAFTGGEFGWHSDYTFWHYHDGMSSCEALTVIFPLTDMTAVNGPLMVMPGSHRYWFNRDWSNRPPADSPIIHDTQEDQDYETGMIRRKELHQLRSRIGVEAVGITAPAGSMILMHGNLVHASGPNISPMDRTCLFVVLNSSSNKLSHVPENSRRPNYYTDRTFQEIDG